MLTSTPQAATSHVHAWSRRDHNRRLSHDHAAARPVNKAAPRSSTPVFVLDNGRFSAFDAPGPAPHDITRINNRGEIAGGIRDVQNQ
jgi:hypothetical protein